MKFSLITVLLFFDLAQGVKTRGFSSRLSEKEESPTLTRKAWESSHRSSDGHKSPMTIDLGNVRPESIQAGPGSTVFVSQIAYGGISSVDLKSGKIRQIVPKSDFLDRGAMAVGYTGEAFIVPGGGPIAFGYNRTAVYVYDEGGRDVVTCAPLVGDDGFMNDVAFVGRNAYITDSATPNLMVLDARKAIYSGVCDVSSIPLPNDFFDVPFPGANGISDYKNGLIIGATSTGAIYFLDLTDMGVTQIVEPGGAPSLDGILVQDDTMYVTQLNNYISVWALSGGTYGRPVTAVEKGKLTSPLYRSASVSDIKGQFLYTTNLRLELGFPAPGEGNLTTFDEDFDIVSVYNVFGSQCEDW